GSRSSIRTYGYVTNGLCQFASPIARFVGNPSIRRRSCTSSPNFRALSPECDFVKLGFATRIETINAAEAWLGSLPGHTVPNVRRPLAHTDNVADLLPVTAVWTGR